MSSIKIGILNKLDFTEFSQNYTPNHFFMYYVRGKDRLNEWKEFLRRIWDFLKIVKKWKYFYKIYQKFSGMIFHQEQPFSRSEFILKMLNLEKALQLQEKYLKISKIFQENFLAWFIKSQKFSQIIFNPNRCF